MSNAKEVGRLETEAVNKDMLERFVKSVTYIIKGEKAIMPYKVMVACFVISVIA